LVSPAVQLLVQMREGAGPVPAQPQGSSAGTPAGQQAAASHQAAADQQAVATWAAAAARVLLAEWACTGTPPGAGVQLLVPSLCRAAGVVTMPARLQLELERRVVDGRKEGLKGDMLEQVGWPGC